jgi:anti-anti-sigma factor
MRKHYRLLPVREPSPPLLRVIMPGLLRVSGGREMGSVEHGPVYLQITSTGSPRGFRLEGELDVSTAPSLVEALTPEIRQGGDLTLDLTDLSFMDSIGLLTLIKAARELRSRGNLILFHPGNLVRSLLRLGVGMNKIPNLVVVDEDSGR